MSAFHIDLIILFAGIAWIIFNRFNLSRINPIVAWAYAIGVGDVLQKNILKLTISLVFSLLCIIFFGIRLYLVLVHFDADYLVRYVIPVLASFYGAYIIFLNTIFTPIANDKRRAYEMNQQAG